MKLLIRLFKVLTPAQLIPSECTPKSFKIYRAGAVNVDGYARFVIQDADPGIGTTTVWVIASNQQTVHTPSAHLTV